MTLATNMHAAAPPSQTGNRGGLLEHALAYLRQGWSVVPVIPNEKRPFIKWKEFQSRLPSEDEARRWWSAYPKARIGLVLGEVSGVVVADVDPRNGGDSAAFLAAHPTELVSESGGGGIHAFYRIDHELREKDCVHLPGIDMQMEGHIVVLPPSLHVSGRPYSWLREGAAAPFPTSLLAPPPPPRAAPPALEAGGAWMADHAARVVNLVAPYWVEGERHSLALALAGALMKSGGATRDETKAVLTALEGERSTDLADRLAAVDTTAERLAQGENVEAWSGLSAYLPEAIVTALREVIAPATTVEITDNAGLTLPFRRTSVLLANLPPEPPWLWEGFVAGGIVTLLARILEGGEATPVFSLLDAPPPAG